MRARGKATDKSGTPPYLKRLGQFGPLTVYLVDGNYVRARYYVDFTIDGHDRVYPEFIPPGEGWLDDAVPLDERGYALHHMLQERELMAGRGVSYDRAHEVVSVPEQAERRADLGLGKRAGAAIPRKQRQIEKEMRQAWLRYMAGLRERVVKAMAADAQRGSHEHIKVS